MKTNAHSRKIRRGWGVAVLAGVIGLSLLIGLHDGSVAGASAPLSVCQHLSVARGPQISPATQELAVAVTLVNRGSQSCELTGYPSLILRSATQGVLGFVFQHEPTSDFDITTAPPHRVVLTPRGHAFFLVAKLVCETGEGAGATSMLVTPPGTKQSLRLALDYPRIDFCSGGSAAVENRVSVTPVEPSVDSLWLRS